jgi:hypothetical protein
MASQSAQVGTWSGSGVPAHFVVDQESEPGCVPTHLGLPVGSPNPPGARGQLFLPY